MDWVQVTSVVFISFFFGVLIFSAYTDLVKGKIYNWVTYPAIICGFLFRIITDGSAGFLSSLAGFFLGFFLLFLFFAAGGVGAGDVKLTAAVGAFGGWFFLLQTLYYTALIGGFVAIAMLIIKGELGSGLKRSMLFLKNLFLPAGKKVSLSEGVPITVPFGAVIVAGAYLAFFLHEI